MFETQHLGKGGAVVICFEKHKYICEILQNFLLAEDPEVIRKCQHNFRSL